MRIAPWPFMLMLLAELASPAGPVHAAKLSSRMDAAEPNSELARLSSAKSISPEFAPFLVATYIATSTQRGLAAYCLEKIGSPAGESIRAAWPRPMDSQGRQGLLHLAWKIDPSEKSYEMIIDAARNNDGHVQASAVGLLGRMGPNSKKAFPLLMQLLRQHPSDTLGREVVAAFGRIGAPAIPTLIEELRTGLLPEDSFGFHGPQSALSAIGEPAGSELLSVISDGNPNARRTAMRSLAGIKPSSSKTRAAMRKLLTSDDPVLRASAVEILGDAEIENDALITALLDDPDRMVQARAAQAIGKMGPRGASSAHGLIRLLSLPHSGQTAGLQWAAIDALGRVRAQSAVEPLRRILMSDLDSNSRNCAARALGRIGEAAKPSVPDLIKSLGDGSVRQVCIVALGRLGPAAKEAVPRLMKLLKQRERSNCHQGTMLSKGRMSPFNCGYYATIALGKMGVFAAPAVPSLVSALEKDKGAPLLAGGAGNSLDRAQARYALFRALEKIGTPAARAAVARNGEFETGRDEVEDED